MKRTVYCLLMLIALTSLSACSKMPKMFWESDDETASASRAPLKLPAELRGELQLPEAEEQVALTEPAAPLPRKYEQVVAKAGKQVALNARLYDVQAGVLLSSAVDAMTQLNLPVNSIDSPSGIITTDWVRKGATGMTDTLLGSMGMTAVINVIRYRFIVRVFRLKEGSLHQSRAEILLLTQAYQNGHWVNKRSLPDRMNELFSAIENQLARVPKQQPSVPAIEVEQP